MDYAAIAAGVAPSTLRCGALFVALVLVPRARLQDLGRALPHVGAGRYTGAPLPVTTFLAVGSKAAGFAMLLRFFAFAVTASGLAPAVAGVPLTLPWQRLRRHDDLRQPGGTRRRTVASAYRPSRTPGTRSSGWSSPAGRSDAVLLYPSPTT
jgi:hypothetical protein